MTDDTAPVPGAMTRQQSIELIAVLMTEGLQEAVDYLHRLDSDVSPLFILDYLAAVTGKAVRILHPHDPGEFYALIPPQDATPPPWLQLLIAAANEDSDMMAAHVLAIAHQGEEVLGHSIGAMLQTARPVLLAAHAHDHPEEKP